MINTWKMVILPCSITNNRKGEKDEKMDWTDSAYHGSIHTWMHTGMCGGRDKKGYGHGDHRGSKAAGENRR